MRPLRSPIYIAIQFFMTMSATFIFCAGLIVVIEMLSDFLHHRFGNVRSRFSGWISHQTDRLTTN